MFVLMGALVGASAFFAWWKWSPQDVPGAGDVPHTVRVTHAATNMRKEFYESLDPALAGASVPEPVRGMITSHHLFMEAELGVLFTSVRNQQPSVVVVVGPNHFGAGSSSVQISQGDFATPFGTLRNADDVTAEIVAAGAALPEERPFDAEHSIGAVTPYIASVWPKTRIVPIILKRSASKAQVDRLSDVLQRILPEDAIVIASVDFSHHLDRFSAAFHDAQSVDALASGDTERLNSSEVDSPQSLDVLLRYLRGRKALHMDWKRTDQAVHTPDLASNDVTSYVFATFTEGWAAEARIRTFMHYGLTGSSGLSEQALLEMGDAEGNYFRGSDAKVLGVTALHSCDVSAHSRLKKFELNVFPVGQCLVRYDVGGIRFLSGPNAVREAGNQGVGPVIVQVKTGGQVDSAIGSGTDVVFVEQGKPGIIVRQGVPVIFLGSAPTFGLAAGLVFTKDGTTVYLFPYGRQGKALSRLTTEQRVEICNAILSPNLLHDGCKIDIQK